MSAVGKVGFKVVGLVAGLVAGKVSHTVLNTAWRKTKGHEPPADPAAPGTSWSEAITWAAASGVAIAVGKLVATKGTAAAWTKATGSPPEGIEASGNA